ncbi:hypothetical protein F4779DRAFT_607866 [Xylariaceae sp. FL0662B]|nr:hypothetical protein F4779DRAFT_607866 [Xylariaceae sp. FL0662B]
MSNHLNFLAIPPELRLLIYRNVFQGSSVGLIHRQRNSEGSGPVADGQPSETFVTSDYPSILLTCKQCYNEGLALFWQETRVIVRVREYPYASALFLLDRCLSGFAKANIKHIRDVELRRRSYHMAHQATQEALDKFPRLETYQVSLGWTRIFVNNIRRRRHPDLEYYNNQQGLRDRIIAQFLGMDPHEYLRTVYGIDPATCKTQFFICARFKSDDGNGKPVTKTCWLNLNTGKCAINPHDTTRGIKYMGLGDIRTKMQLSPTINIERELFG